ncbi:sensor histidine kinase [Microbacterium sulfonylureivorans]|uniref:sensor histidine kinase n=1 Tax=Microbacterium sulfonylureivorans TaxID=2486854 RepID=UPI000FD9F71B|nr:HAMP domain-containing sensor histidine kinase [Microbacterium sulfonylureivorans]
MSDAADQERVRRSARRVGLWVGAASAVVIAAGVGILLIIMSATSRPERGGDDDGPWGERDNDHIVVDVDRIVPWIVVLGIIGVALLSLVAWYAARTSVRPLALALRAQRNFVSDASHELRTPLTALSARIQLLQRRHEHGDPIDDTIRDLRRNAAVMDDVLTDLLLSAEAEAIAPPAPTDVVACARAAADSLEPLARAQNVTIVLEAATAPLARVPAVTLTRLIVALVDNAIQHSPDGAAVHVAVGASARFVELRVRDDGDGIAPPDRDRVFERFARGDETGRRRGFGLGLALVREMATRYGGTVIVEATSPSGTTFLARLPQS